MVGIHIHLYVLEEYEGERRLEGNDMVLYFKIQTATS